MKTFIYTVTNERARQYGGTNYDLKVYRIKRNRPEFIGQSRPCTAAHKGYDGEAVSILADNDELTKSEIGNGYYDRNNETFRLYKV